MTVLSSLFEYVGKQEDAIINALRRTKPVPPQPSVRNRPSGHFELDINIDENQYSFEMGENGNIEYVNEKIYEEGRYFKRIDSISEKIYERAPEDVANEVSRMFNQYDNVGVFSNYPIDDPEGYEIEVFFGILVVLIAYNNDRGMVEEISVFYEGENFSSFVYGDITTEFDNAAGILTFEDEDGYIRFEQVSDELLGYNP